MKNNKDLKNVYVIGPTYGVEEYFIKYGYTPYTDHTVNKAEEIDIVCWMGGSDISPELYNQQQISGTMCNPERDKREVLLWQKYRHLPKIGICRGAQLLNVLNGGSMYQHVDGHCEGPHVTKDRNDNKFIVCSVHHQLMIPNPDNTDVISWSMESNIRWDDKGSYKRKDNEIDPEVLWIPSDKALCFQAHPEFGPKSCTDYFFNLVEEYLH